jgi:hypothetical protein
MTHRFSPDHRSSWRERFLAIARELDGRAAHRRDSLDADRPARGRYLPARQWRGLRLACRAS